jgi:HSP20 family protein
MAKVFKYYIDPDEINNINEIDKIGDIVNNITQNITEVINENLNDNLKDIFTNDFSESMNNDVNINDDINDDTNKDISVDIDKNRNNDRNNNKYNNKNDYRNNTKNETMCEDNMADKVRFTNKYDENQDKKTQAKFDESIEKSKAFAGKLADDLGNAIDDVVVNLKAVHKDVDSKINTYKETSVSKIDVDLVDVDNVYYLKADLPGVKKEDVNIEILGKKLVIKAFFNSICEDIKLECDGDTSYNYLLKGRKFGSAERTINLPNKVKNDGVTAEFSNGSLFLVLPQVEVEKVKININ